MALCCLSLGIGVGIGYAGDGVSEWDWFQATGSYTSTSTYTEIDTNEIHMTNGVDNIRLVGDDDVIWMANGDDTINMGPTDANGLDTITFYDGDAKLEFHDPASDSLGAVKIEYDNSTEDTKFTVSDHLIIQLGQ